ncbi:glycosyltransferase [Formosa sp. S-31]|uniref:glycosyltransferase n=1 Tax=Formosa sp. S-31 TaxID=2790949 RepID=UPI003EB7CC39
MDKTVLIVSYYWPPAGGPGVQRWLKFVKYLPEFNVKPIVYIPDNPNYPIIDESLSQEQLKEVTILKQPIKEPYKLAALFSKSKSKTISKGIISENTQQSVIEKLMLFVRGNFFIPDARISWVKPSVKYLKAYLVKHPVDAIITTGPPHSLHLIGLQLKSSLNIKWLADFRDPWTTIGYHKALKLTEESKRKHKSLENKVLNSADDILVTSQVTKKEFESITTRPIHVITNGYDTEQSGTIIRDEQFTLSHIGSLLSKRNPKMLWRVLQDLINSHDDFASDFKLHIVGSVSQEVVNTLEKFNLLAYYKNFGYVSHKEAIVFQKQSQLLLLIEIDSPDTQCIIPGKLFEYMVSNRPILALGPEGSDVERIIKETNTGNYFYYNDYDALKDQIYTHYKAFKGGRLESFPIGLQQYSRKSLTATLAKLV